MKITDAVECPKCRKPFLKESINPTFGKEYFCHFCHEYFGVNELVNVWNYDAGDLCPQYPVTFGNYKGWLRGDLPTEGVTLSATTAVQAIYYSEFDGGEPIWESVEARGNSYEVVSNMYAGLSEMEAFEVWKRKFDNDYADLIATQNAALDRGIQ